MSLNWTYSGSADSFEIERRAPGGTFVPHGTSATTTFTGAASANTAYLYRVRAKKASTFSAWSNLELATTVMFSDPAMQGFVGASHVTEVRTAVNAVRGLAGLAAASFTDANLTGVVWRAVHIEELRNALTAARAQLALPGVSYTDPGSLAGLFFKAAYVTDLRGGVQ